MSSDAPPSESPTLSLPQLDEIGETMIAQRLSMIDGVAQVQVFGASKYAVRVQLDPKQLEERDVELVRYAVDPVDEHVGQPREQLDQRDPRIGDVVLGPLRAALGDA